MSVFFIFVDGMGLGKEDDHNPLVNNDYKMLRKMTGGQKFSQNVESLSDKFHFFRGVDACLNVDGLPQSGTGQAALFSGQNAPDIAGRHFGPFPHSKTRFLLQKESLFHHVQVLGATCHFMNAYPEAFFEEVDKKGRWTCTTLMARSSGIALNRTSDVKRMRALTADITQHSWRNDLDIDVPVITTEEAADRVFKVLKRYDLVLFEYFLTDKAGHKQQRRYAHRVIDRLDSFLNGIIYKMPAEHNIVFCSDHGNIEDLSVKTHTRNQVPLFVKGPAAPFFSSARKITDVTPSIISYFRSLSDYC